MRFLHVKSSRLICLAIYLVVVFVTLSYVPRYLTYENDPRRTECIILLVGPDYDLRRNRALELMAEGYSKYLVIPSFDRVYVCSEKGINPHLWQSEKESHFIDAMRSNDRFRFYEKTHLEILFAKKTLDMHRFRSITFVSSPYHMRRVKFIAESVFAAKYYHPTYVTYGTGNSHSFLWMFQKEDLKWVTSEYIKIVWFMFYSSLS